MTTLHFSKLHATGNDFLVRVALEPGATALAPTTVAAMCDRHRGIGADGIITVAAGGDGADCTMILQNADGGRAEMSGNGIRCVAFVAAREGLGTRNTLVVDTDGGRRVVSLERDAQGMVVAADVGMGAITLGATDLELWAGDTCYAGDVASIGNPHVVCLVPDPAAVPLTQHGPAIECDARFPHRTNVEFVHVADAETIDMRVWERGAGETMSCGTGACAAAAVAHRRGLVGERVAVRVAGGELRVALGADVTLGGPVVHVFDVDLDLDLDGRS
jgi:diaminopimelate epimerase